MNKVVIVKLLWRKAFDYDQNKSHLNVNSKVKKATDWEERFVRRNFKRNAS